MIDTISELLSAIREYINVQNDSCNIDIQMTVRVSFLDCKPICKTGVRVHWFMVELRTMIFVELLTLILYLLAGLCLTHGLCIKVDSSESSHY